MNHRILLFLFIIFGVEFFIEGIGIENRKFHSTTEKENTATSYQQLADSNGFSEMALSIALKGLNNLIENRVITNDSILSLIDYDKPSDSERFYVINLKNGKLIYKSLVAHGKNSGVVTPTNFSNCPRSFMSSLGLFVTSDTYQGKHGYSLRLIGMDKGLNDNALSRSIVIHGANYVSEDYIKQNGRIGRSYGCPALPTATSTEIIDEIKNGSCLFIYHSSLISSQYQPGKRELMASSSRL